MAVMIRVELPQHLRTLAHVGHEVPIEVEGPVTQRSVLDAIEDRYPMLKGAIRDHGTMQRRAFLGFFACQEDLTHEPPDAPLPEAVAAGTATPTARPAPTRWWEPSSTRTATPGAGPRR